MKLSPMMAALVLEAAETRAEQLHAKILADIVLADAGDAAAKNRAEENVALLERQARMIRSLENTLLAAPPRQEDV